MSVLFAYLLAPNRRLLRAPSVFPCRGVFSLVLQKLPQFAL